MSETPRPSKPVITRTILGYLTVLVVAGGLYALGGSARSVGEFAAGVVLLLWGGQMLVDGAVALARSAGIPPLVVGLTVVAFGTSAPELAFNLTAAINGTVELSFGNIVGSNIANVGLVLGLAAMIRPILVHGSVVRKEAPLMLLVSAGFLALAWLPPMVPTDAGPVAGWSTTAGAVLLVAFSVFLYGWYRAGKTSPGDDLGVELASAAAEEAATIRTTGMAIVVFVIGLLLLVGGGRFTEQGAVGLALSLGLGEAIIGLTIVAIATSLPEVVTSVIAAIRGQSDLAVGNVIGSNVFNLLLVMGATALVTPVPMPPGGGLVDLLVMAGLSILLWIFVQTKDRTISRAEGTTLLVLYASYLVYVVIRA